MMFNTAREALRRWDRGDTIYSINMGGMSQRYEQDIQTTAFELIRANNDNPFDPKRADDDAYCIQHYDELVDAVYKKGSVAEQLPLSGAQMNAAANLAYMFIVNGHREGIETAPANRKIFVTKQEQREDG